MRTEKSEAIDSLDILFGDGDDGDGDGDDGGYFDGSAVRVDGLQGRRLADCKMRKSGERVTRYLDNNQVIRDQVIRDQMIRKNMLSGNELCHEIFR